MHVFITGEIDTTIKPNFNLHFIKVEGETTRFRLYNSEIKDEVSSTTNIYGDNGDGDGGDEQDEMTTTTTTPTVPAAIPNPPPGPPHNQVPNLNVMYAKALQSEPLVMADPKRVLMGNSLIAASFPGHRHLHCPHYLLQFHRLRLLCMEIIGRLEGLAGEQDLDGIEIEGGALGQGGAGGVGVGATDGVSSATLSPATVELSNENNPEIFWAASAGVQTSLGNLGWISDPQAQGLSIELSQLDLSHFRDFQDGCTQSKPELCLFEAGESSTDLFELGDLIYRCG
ncbi:hypothetical protein BYT27DRAFT_7215915 [Phlegmacium glaucopus]|nr:hypothetical protein BYT27DRAFT_7215915 [Phlegmacium glaucopus]